MTGARRTPPSPGFAQHSHAFDADLGRWEAEHIAHRPRPRPPVHSRARTRTRLRAHPVGLTCLDRPRRQLPPELRHQIAVPTLVAALAFNWQWAGQLGGRNT